MSFLKSISKAVRSVYDATSKSSSKLGRIGKYAVPFNAPYLTRDAWRSVSKRFGMSAVNSAGSYRMYSGSHYGPTGSIVGRGVR